MASTRRGRAVCAALVAAAVLSTAAQLYFVWQRGVATLSHHAPGHPAAGTAARDGGGAPAGASTASAAAREPASPTAFASPSPEPAARGRADPAAAELPPSPPADELRAVRARAHAALASPNCTVDGAERALAARCPHRPSLGALCEMRSRLVPFCEGASSGSCMANAERDGVLCDLRRVYIARRGAQRGYSKRAGGGDGGKLDRPHHVRPAPGALRMHCDARFTPPLAAATAGGARYRDSSWDADLWLGGGALAATAPANAWPASAAGSCAPGTTLGVLRYSAPNFYHNFEALLAALESLFLAGVPPGAGVRVLFLDNYRRTQPLTMQFEPLWAGLLSDGPARHFWAEGQRTPGADAGGEDGECFERLLLPFSQRASHTALRQSVLRQPGPHCLRPNPLLLHVLRHARAALAPRAALLAEPDPSGAPPSRQPPLRVVLSARRHLAVGGDSKTISRQLGNEDEVVAALRDMAAELGARRGVAARVERHDFAALTLAQQLELDARTHVLVGNHGAGLTHCAFLPPRASCVEISSGCDKPAAVSASVAFMYSNLARWTGHGYACFYAPHAREVDGRRVDARALAAVVRAELEKQLMTRPPRGPGQGRSAGGDDDDATA